MKEKPLKSYCGWKMTFLSGRVLAYFSSANSQFPGRETTRHQPSPWTSKVREWCSTVRLLISGDFFFSRGGFLGLNGGGGFGINRKIGENSSESWYCWWKKSCTSWYSKYPMIYRVVYIPGGAGFLPSTVLTEKLMRKLDTLQGANIHIPPLELRKVILKGTFGIC